MRRLQLTQLTGMNQHYRRYPYSQFLDSMVTCGIQSLEMWCGAPHFMLDSQSFSDPAPFRHMANERGLRYVSLTAPSMMWQHQYAIHGKERQKRAISYYKNAVRVAAELEVSVMSINAGWGYWDHDPTEAEKWSLDTIAHIADLACTMGVTLALETLQPMESNIVLHLADAKRFLDTLHHPAVKAMVDIVAAGVAGETPEDWFQVFGKDLIHCHLIDGSPSGHQAFGDGEFPLEEILNTFERHNYSHFLTMELGGTYLQNPFHAEHRNMQALRRFISK